MGKLLLAAGARLAGYDPSVCHYAEIGQVFDPACKYLSMRVTSGARAPPPPTPSRLTWRSPHAATFGAALPPLVFVIARELEMSPWGAALAAVFVILDGLNTIESRLILVDSSLMLLSAIALCVGPCDVM